MRFKLLKVTLLSLSVSFISSISYADDVEINLKTATQNQTIFRGQWANIASGHCIHVKNNTNDKKWFKYYLKLCVENGGCSDMSKEFTVAAHEDWGDTCNTLNVQKQFNGIGFRQIVATTNVSGDKDQSNESRSTLQINP